MLLGLYKKYMLIFLTAWDIGKDVSLVFCFYINFVDETKH